MRGTVLDLEEHVITTSIHNDVASVELSGELDVATVPALRQAAVDVLASDRCIVVDCSRLEFIDCAGGAPLAAAAAAARRRGRDFWIVGARPRIRLVLTFLGMTGSVMDSGPVRRQGRVRLGAPAALDRRSRVPRRSDSVSGLRGIAR